MASQENTQPGPSIHEEIFIENTDSDQEPEHVQEAEYVKVENEKNIIKSYESTMMSPKLNTSNDVSRAFYKPTPQTQLSTKLTEWNIVTHIKLNKDVQIPPLPIDFKENEDLNKFYCFTKTGIDRNEIFLNMLSLYDTWRAHYNDVNGFNKVEENSERAELGIPQSEEIEADENVEILMEKTPDITDDKDFPSLGGRTRSLRSSSTINKPTTSKQLIEVELDDYEEKEDPDDADFIPVSQTRKKTNKKPVYKKPTENIFDFNESATAWQATAEVASTTKRPEPKIIKPEPAVKEETVACPICNKPFPMSEIENHASDCSSFEDSSAQTRKRCKTQNPPRKPPLLENIEDDILLSDDDRAATDSTSGLVIPESSTPRTNKRPLTRGGSTTPSPTKKPCLYPN